MQRAALTAHGTKPIDRPHIVLCRQRTKNRQPNGFAVTCPLLFAITRRDARVPLQFVYRAINGFQPHAHFRYMHLKIADA